MFPGSGGEQLLPGPTLMEVNAALWAAKVVIDHPEREREGGERVERGAHMA